MTHPLRVAENCSTHPLHKAQNFMAHPLSAPAHPHLYFLTSPLRPPLQVGVNEFLDLWDLDGSCHAHMAVRGQR